jgi:hypothetical protein
LVQSERSNTPEHKATEPSGNRKLPETFVNQLALASVCSQGRTCLWSTRLD